MNSKQRAGAVSRALVPAVICIAACGMGAGVWAQAAKRSAATDSGSQMAASVNGQVITRAEVVDDLLNQQAAKLTATNPIFKDKQRPTAAAIGALVLKRMAANGWQQVTVTRADVANWLFTDKPDVLVADVQRLIQERLVTQAATKAGVTVTPAELDAQMVKTLDVPRKNMHLAGNDDSLLKQIGVTRGFLRPIVKTQLLLQKLVRKDMDTKAGHQIGDADYLEAKHILVSVKPDPMNPADNEKKWAEAKAKIDAILADLRSGKKKFETVAQETNEDSTKFKGGSLGVFMRGQMVPEFDRAAFSQPVGKISDPVKSQFGWHLILVDRTGKEMTGPEKAQLLEASVNQRIGQKVQELMKTAKIVNNVPPPAPQPGMGMPG